MKQPQTKNTNAVEGWRERFDRLTVPYQHPGIIEPLVLQEEEEKVIQDFIQTELNKQKEETIEEVWKDVRPLITVWSGDTARSVGTRVGEYFVALKKGKETTK